MPNVWWPDCNAFLENVTDTGIASRLYFHQQVSGNSFAINSVTIDNTRVTPTSIPCPPGSTCLSEDLNTPSAIAFAVEAINSRDPRPIAQFKNSELEVDVYLHHDGENLLTTIRNPDRTFKIKLAADTSDYSLAHYWHVFNLVWVNGEYRVVALSDNTNGAVRNNGSIETGWFNVQCNIPGELTAAQKLLCE